ncbi:MAG TPA: sialidase family protein [Candidatus Binatia bacterium]|nr:sialidase family protein [Candidatus Binatia bacterium]
MSCKRMPAEELKCLALVRRRRVAFAALVVVLVAATLFLNTFRGNAAPAVNLIWDTPKLLSTNATNGAFRPVLRQAANGTLMVAYNQRKSNNTQNPSFTRSTDDGETWTTPAPIRSSGSDLRQVTLAFDGSGTAHAVWRSSAGLAHAAQPQWPNGEHTIVSTSDVLFDPYLAIGSDNVLHVVWAQEYGDQGLHDIFHAYSSDGGVTWSAPRNLVSDNDRHSSAPVAVLDAANNVHVFWEERIFDPSQSGFFRYEIHYKKGTKSGSNYTWPSTATIVSGNLTSARRPAAVASGNIIHLSFARQVANEEQYPYYRRFVPGSGWSTVLDASSGHPVSVNTNSPFFLISSVAACNNGVYIYYHGSEETNAKEQIFGASDYDSWATQDVVTNDDVRHVNPNLICRGGSLYLTIERVEVATINHQIYFTASRNINQVNLPVIMRP